MLCHPELVEGCFVILSLSKDAAGHASTGSCFDRLSMTQNELRPWPVILSLSKDAAGHASTGSCFDGLSMTQFDGLSMTQFDRLSMTQFDRLSITLRRAQHNRQAQRDKIC